MQERTVLASFHSEADASRAAEQIRALGIPVAQVDELHAYGGEPPERHAFIISGQFPGLASITLSHTPDSRDAGVLLAADPSASGMSDGEDNVTGRNWLLTVVCPEHLVEDVVRLIKDCGGYT
ncbi:MAG: hypothetical protein IRZ33_01140 [Alicyclobacillaceae bacterium]|nr:hypothetical protein [Alicyclobacillaceae bacterium]